MSPIRRSLTSPASERTPGVAAFDLVLLGQVRLGAALIDATAFDPQLASVGTTVVDGRLPATPDEVALGPRLAEQLGLAVGDELALDERGGGRTVRLRIVGLATPQPSGVRVRLGMAAVLHPDALLGLAPTPPYRVAHVRAAPGSAEALAADLERDLEIRALGFTAGQIRTALAVMVGAVVVPALALGVPLGLALALDPLVALSRAGGW